MFLLKAQGHLAGTFGRQSDCSLLRSRAMSTQHWVRFPAASKGDGQPSAGICLSASGPTQPPLLSVGRCTHVCPAQVQASCGLAKYGHKPSCHMGKGREGSGKEHGFGFARFWCVQTLVPISREGATRARESEAPRARHEQEGSWQQRSFESSELAANPLLHSPSCRRKSYDSREKYVV